MSIRHLTRKTIIVFLTAVVLFGCASLDTDGHLRDYSVFFAPLPAEPIYPADNPYSVAKAKLGEQLFWDPILSGDMDVSCASCHHPDFGWADGRTFSVGVGGVGVGPDRKGTSRTAIHSPTILNTAFTGLATNQDTSEFTSGPYFWDHRAKTLEEQSLGPIQDATEMRGDNYSANTILPEVVRRLEKNAQYRRLFRKAFGDDSSITANNIAKAIATFERGVVSGESRFDKFIAGDASVFSEEERLGINKFIDHSCTNCHTGPMLSDNKMPVWTYRLSMRFHGNDFGNVRTPSLRNISKTAPYMHKGQEVSLEDMVASYEETSRLDEEDIKHITQFLLTLDSDVYTDIPDSVPSGLEVGGKLSK